MLLIPEEVLDLLPAEVGLALLVHHQVAEDQQEAVATEVKAPPEVTTSNAGLPPVIPGHKCCHELLVTLLVYTELNSTKLFLCFD